MGFGHSGPSWVAWTKMFVCDFGYGMGDGMSWQSVRRLVMALCEFNASDYVCGVGGYWCLALVSGSYYA